MSLNDYLQSKKFDKNAGYIKQWVPELKGIDTKHLQDEEYLLVTKINEYPQPMVVHKESKNAALEYFKKRV